MNLATVKSNYPWMNMINYLLAIHKWTVTQVVSVLFTLPLIGDVPEGVAGMGLLTFLFACWKQWEAVKMQRREMKMKEEWHDERIRTVRALRSGKLENVDIEIVKEILEK